MNQKKKMFLWKYSSFSKLTNEIYLFLLEIAVKKYQLQLVW